MTVKQNTFEGQSNGTTLTAGNSGSGSGDAFASVNLTASTCTFSTAQKMHGSNGLAFSATATQNVDIRWTFTANNVVAVRAYVRFGDVAPSGTVFPIAVRTAAGTLVAAIGVNASSRLVATTGTGSTVIAATNVSGNAVVTNTWYRVEVIFTVGASTSTGRIQYKAYAGDSLSSFIDYDSGTTLNLGTTALGQVRLGKNDAAPTWTGTHYLDDVAYEEGRTTLIGVPGAAPPSPDDLVYPYSVTDNDDVWTKVGAAADIVASLGDSDNTTYAQSPELAGSPLELEVLLAPLNDDAGRAARVVITASVSSDVGADASVLVYQGATLRATLPFSPTTTPTEFVLPMTALETAAVTNWSDVRLRFKYEP